MGQAINITRAELELLIKSRLSALANAVAKQEGMQPEPIEFLRHALTEGLEGVKELVDQLRGPNLSVRAVFDRLRSERPDLMSRLGD